MPSPTSTRSRSAASRATQPQSHHRADRGGRDGLATASREGLVRRAARSTRAIVGRLGLGRRQARELLLGVERRVLADVAHDATVAHGDHTGRARCDVALVGHEHDGDASLAVQALEQREDLEARARVEVARRLVGEEQGRVR